MDAAWIMIASMRSDGKRTVFGWTGLSTNLSYWHMKRRRKGSLRKALARIPRSRGAQLPCLQPWQRYGQDANVTLAPAPMATKHGPAPMAVKHVPAPEPKPWQSHHGNQTCACAQGKGVDAEVLRLKLA
eukprot:1159234-Pelagomonas_calceolata.AAC.4